MSEEGLVNIDGLENKIIVLEVADRYCVENELGEKVIDMEGIQEGKYDFDCLIKVSCNENWGGNVLRWYPSNKDCTVVRILEDNQENRDKFAKAGRCKFAVDKSKLGDTDD